MCLASPNPQISVHGCKHSRPGHLNFNLVAEVGNTNFVNVYKDFPMQLILNKSINRWSRFDEELDARMPTLACMLPVPRHGT